MNFSPIKTNLNFKGYDAAPLKGVFLSGRIDDETIVNSMSEIGQKEGFSVQQTKDTGFWIQDYQTILCNKDGAFLLHESDFNPIKIMTSRKLPSRSKYNYNVTYRKQGKMLPGGNFFIGKKPDGEKWLMVGQNELQHIKIEQIQKLYAVKPENIFIIPQQNYHLDTFLRPVGYPYVLVNDPDMARKNVDEMDCSEEDKELLRDDLNKYDRFLRAQKQTTVDKTIETLEEYGFIPIRIAGCYGLSVNFMNAIVNRQPNGKISYITASSKCTNEAYSRLQEIFEKDLKEKVENLGRVHFAKSKINHNDSRPSNYLMQMLRLYEGCLHCMSLEEPDFEKWA